VKALNAQEGEVRCLICFRFHPIKEMRLAIRIPDCDADGCLYVCRNCDRMRVRLKETAQ
jgi:hypothetical protein